MYKKNDTKIYNRPYNINIHCYHVQIQYTAISKCTITASLCIHSEQRYYIFTDILITIIWCKIHGTKFDFGADANVTPCNYKMCKYSTCTWIYGAPESIACVSHVPVIKYIKRSLLKYFTGCLGGYCPGENLSYSTFVLRFAWAGKVPQTQLSPSALLPHDTSPYLDTE